MSFLPLSLRELKALLLKRNAAGEWLLRDSDVEPCALQEAMTAIRREWGECLWTARDLCR